MDGNDDILDREAEGGTSYDPEDRPVLKPPRRLDTLSECMLLLSHAVTLLGKSLDEGPLRTAVIERASQATKLAATVRYDPSKARPRRGRTVRAPAARSRRKRVDRG